MAPLFNLPSPRTGAEPARWCQLAGSISSLAIADAARTDTRPWLVIENGAQALEQRQAELRFYGGSDLPLWQLPDWEMLPYDSFAPHPDLISDRLRTLAALPHLTHGIVLVSIDTLPMRLPPRQYIESRSFQLRPGQQLGLVAAPAPPGPWAWACTSRPAGGPAALAARGGSGPRSGSRRPARAAQA